MPLEESIKVRELLIEKSGRKSLFPVDFSLIIFGLQNTALSEQKYRITRLGAGLHAWASILTYRGHTEPICQLGGHTDSLHLQHR